MRLQQGWISQVANPRPKFESRIIFCCWPLLPKLEVQGAVPLAYDRLLWEHHSVCPEQMKDAEFIYQCLPALWPGQFGKDDACHTSLQHTFWPSRRCKCEAWQGCHIPQPWLLGKPDTNVLYLNDNTNDTLHTFKDQGQLTASWCATKAVPWWERMIGDNVTPPCWKGFVISPKTLESCSHLTRWYVVFQHSWGNWTPSPPPWQTHKAWSRQISHPGNDDFVQVKSFTLCVFCEILPVHLHLSGSIQSRHAHKKSDT